MEGGTGVRVRKKNKDLKEMPINRHFFYFIQTVIRPRKRLYIANYTDCIMRPGAFVYIAQKSLNQITIFVQSDKMKKNLKNLLTNP